MTVPNLSAAALAIGLGAGQPGFGQAISDDLSEEEKKRRKLLGSANALGGQLLSPAALSLNLGQAT
jgi:hypothetical protein